ncbi:MAG TPA: Rap1a/Tai family immunity protein [Parasulfuritortus sp.]
MKRVFIAAMAGLSLPFAALAEIGEAGHRMQTGEGLMRMCFGGIQVQALSIMCHNYINGYLDAVATGAHPGKYCFGKGGIERLSPSVVTWLMAHPDYQKRPAPAALDRVLSEQYACRK